MSPQQLKRRSYGYVEKGEKRSFSRTPTPPPKGRGIWGTIKAILLFPFRLIGRLFGSKKGKVGRFLLTAIATIGILGLVGGVGFAAWVSKDLPDPDRLTDREVAQSTKIFDRTGTVLLYEIYGDEKRTLIPYDQIPLKLRQALIATEDTTFYEHHGVRPLSIVRSVIFGLMGRNRIGGGASTLTQQLVKNAILSNEAPWSRKPKELILSVRLEQKYTKDQILQIYFNEIPYGGTNYGVEAAAQSYYNKRTTDLNLEQIATLAGFPKQPSRYLNDLPFLKERRNFVLRRMKEEGYITEEEMRETQAMELSFKPKEYTDIKAPHFVLYVKELLEEEFGGRAVNTGGFKVITSLDWEKQQMAEAAIETQKDKVLKDAKADNAALVSIDPKTGQILALVGSIDFFSTSSGQYNVITSGKRQPGSSIKPIVYTAAFEKGYTPDTLLFDVETNFGVDGSKAYIPKNYDLKEYGPVTMRQALQGSLNISAVQTLYLVGLSNAATFSERLGYTTLADYRDYGLTLVLGGAVVNPLEHAMAYSVFAAEGKKRPATSILRIENSQGDVIKEEKVPAGEEVISKDVAATISNVLSDDAARAYVFGANSALTLPDRPVAAKTGTTQEYRDAWTLGYTPNLVTAVWVGNSNGSPMQGGYGGSRLAGVIWNDYMKKATKTMAIEKFPTPPANDAEKPILRGSQGGVTLQIDRVTNKRATSSTPAEYIVDRTYVPPHSILHYVVKDDPRGPAPENPATDPQYAVWEAAITTWATKKQTADPNWSISFEEPPTEYDDLHSLELIPTLTVQSPTPSSTFSTRQLTTSIQVSAPRGVSKVSYRIDNKPVATYTTAPFNLDYTARGLANGPHALTVVVEDDVGNQLHETIPFILQAGVEAPGVSFADPITMIPQGSFPRVFLLEPYRVNDIAELTVSARSQSGVTIPIVSTTNLTDIFNDRLVVTWIDAPPPGSWTIIAEVTDKAGNRTESDRMQVQIQ